MSIHFFAGCSCQPKSKPVKKEEIYMSNIDKSLSMEESVDVLLVKRNNTEFC
jgi:hypothetical protein